MTSMRKVTTFKEAMNKIIFTNLESETAWMTYQSDGERLYVEMLIK